ncbi:aspartate aminotransferase family protein [Microbacterium sp. SORGH_AS_0888]|uniref:aspartate aminotransferase family protein n=1 Tax=Microbacterium sp. SORGH_AS_0888 TaxID=3041791 RepID=UPI00278101B8|nr:aspartate aminotransferase family protein [Microbacterium sp. SORGH_AS_0888]MDQ1130716.1 4-aminobutyrate aminotransferase-like enzyme [Microbacterium sp. SORGH_AS_0888]
MSIFSGTTSTGNASILEGNSFKASDAESLPERARGLVARRTSRLGAAYRLFYREPVELVRGKGAYAWDADGVEYLDLYNNVPSLGHAHPAVVEAVSRQLAQLNTHTRYLHTAILDYADDLASTLPRDDYQTMFVCTGSEANDLALRVGREATGGRAYIATREAYHGNTALVTAHSPSLAGSEPMDAALRVIDPPDTYRHGSAEAAGQAFFASVRDAVTEIEASGDGLAGIILDTSFSSDGVFTGTPGMIAAAIELVQSHGGVFIADEVQPGFARTGEQFWGFARHGLVPDIITTGKPMGNGFPVAGMIARVGTLTPFSSSRPYFNTFGGNPVAIAAAQAVLDTIRHEELQQHALRTGELFRSALRELAEAHEVVGDVRGVGLYTGVELVTDRSGREPATGIALETIEGLRRRGVLTSVCGPSNNILKLRPPLAFAETDIPRAIDALDGALADAARRE